MSATNLLSIAKARPGVMNGFYDYRLAVRIYMYVYIFVLLITSFHCNDSGNVILMLSLSVLSPQLALEKSAGIKFAHGCVPAALHHFAVAAHLLHKGGDGASAEYAESRLNACRQVNNNNNDHSRRAQPKGAA